MRMENTIFHGQVHKHNVMPSSMIGAERGREEEKGEEKEHEREKTGEMNDQEVNYI